MALIVYLTVNSITKEIFVAQRVTNVDTEALSPEAVSDYECYVVKDYDETPKVTVQHRYADPGWDLVAKGLEALRYSGYYAS